MRRDVARQAVGGARPRLGAVASTGVVYEFDLVKRRGVVKWRRPSRDPSKAQTKIEGGT